MNAQPAHMSPSQAAQVVGTSRWTIMRAIKSRELMATRDNRNQWRIALSDLERWRPHNVRTPDEMHTPQTSEAIVELREKLAAAIARAEAAEYSRTQAEADRDRWQKMAEKLAERSTPSWWPWRKRNSSNEGR